MARERVVCEPGSEHEARVAASILYGMIAATFHLCDGEIREQFNYDGLSVEQLGPAANLPGVIYTGLRLRMASGTYRVRIERES